MTADVPGTPCYENSHFGSTIKLPLTKNFRKLRFQPGQDGLAKQPQGLPNGGAVYLVMHACGDSFLYASSFAAENVLAILAATLAFSPITGRTQSDVPKHSVRKAAPSGRATARLHDAFRAIRAWPRRTAQYRTRHTEALPGKPHTSTAVRPTQDQQRCRTSWLFQSACEGQPTEIRVPRSGAVDGQYSLPSSS